jgi:hypothetical protein
MGWGKFLEKIGAEEIDSCDIESDGEDGQRCKLRYELLESTHQFDANQPRWLRMQSPPLKDETQPYYCDPVHPELTSASAARTWRERRQDGSWPTVEQCNSGLLPDRMLRHGDVDFHALPYDYSVEGLKELPGPHLVTGNATGHSHSLVGEHRIYDAGDGMKIVVSTSPELYIDHQEHKLSAITPRKTRQSVLRQYDREHGWTQIVD